MRVADYVIQRLEEFGIEHAFTVCGGGSIFLCDALAHAGRMKYVACHHEQAAAMAAESYARAREGYGFCLVTSGPGGTNAITGCAGAWTDRVPVVFVSGQVFSKQMITGQPGLRTMGVQEINVVDLVTPITKYAVTVTDPRRIKYEIERALWEARYHGAPGPVWIDLPADVQNAKIEPDTLDGFTAPARPSKVSDLAVLAALEVVKLLAYSRRPLIHVGHGVRIADAIPHFERLARILKVPIVTSRNANDIIASDDPLYVGRPGTFAQRGANFAVQTCDLYIAIGTRLSLAQTGYDARDYARNARIVMVDIDPAEIDKGTVRLHRGVCADAREFVEAMLAALTVPLHTMPDWSAWRARCKEWQARYPAVLDEWREENGYVNSYVLVDELSDRLGASDIVVTDMGFAFQNTHQAFRVKRGQRLYTNGGLAAMGWGLPAAIGAAVGTGRRVTAIVGDGGLMMNLQELATLAHLQLKAKVFVLNNGGYLTMRQSQALAFDRYMGSDEESGLSFPDFRRLAEAFNLDYHMAESHEDLRYVLDSFYGEARASAEGPSICEVMMDPDQLQAPKSVNRREADGTIKQTALEDAFPYLPREEIERNLKCEP